MCKSLRNNRIDHKGRVYLFSGAAPRRKATDVRPRYCNQCDKQFYFQEPLDIHIKNVHKDGFQGRMYNILI